MSEKWTILCKVEQVPASEQGGHYVTVGNRAMAIFRNGDAWHVLDDACPHAGGSLSAGHVADGCVFCPWHAWPFNLKTGVCPDNEQVVVRRYQAREREGLIEAQIDSLDAS